MKHKTLRVWLSGLLFFAAFAFFALLFVLNLDKNERFVLIVQSLLFVFLASANYTDRKKALLGQRRTHMIILIVLAVVLSINGYMLFSKGHAVSVFSNLSHYFEPSA